MNKTKKGLIFLATLTGISFLIYTISFFYNSIVELSKNPIKAERIAPNDYINLFNKDAQKHLFLESAVLLKLRNTVAYFVYDNKYELELTAINVKPDFIIKQDIIETYGNTEGVFPTTYLPYNEIDFTSNYNGNSSGIASKIYLSLEGDSTTTMLKNDSVANYYLKLKNVYVQYNPKGLYEIALEAKTKLSFLSKKMPVSILFLKKRDKLYFLLLTVNNDIKLDPDLLAKLIKKE